MVFFFVLKREINYFVLPQDIFLWLESSHMSYYSDTFWPYGIESTLIISYWFLDTSYLYFKCSFVVPLNNSNKNLSCILSYLVTMAQFSSSHPFISKLPVQVVAVQLFSLYMTTKPVVCYHSGFSPGHILCRDCPGKNQKCLIPCWPLHPGAFSVPGWSDCPLESLGVRSLQLSWCQCSSTLLAL